MAHTVVHLTPRDAAGLQAQGLSPLPFGQGLFKTSAHDAVLVSSAVETPAAFDDLVASWNADLPADSVLVLEVQVRGPDGWSSWFELARQEGPRGVSAPRQEGPDGYVDVDTLKPSRPASAWRYRVRISAPGRPAVLRLVAVTVSDAGAPPPAPWRPGPWAAELRLRPRSQMEEQERYRHDICSPTALAMTLDFWGRRSATVAVAEAVRDGRTGIFGHWPFNAAVAGARGLAAHVARLDSLEDLQDQIARGRPVVVSLTFGPGELSGSPIRQTKGHLVVVSGFTPEGNVIVLDPAAPDRKTARRVYDRGEFHRAWRVNKRGLAYLVGPLEGLRLTVGVPVADLLAAPREPRRLDLDDDNRLSQLLYGESVTLQQARGEWARVLADEQPSLSKDGRWQGYRGWMRADALVGAPAPAPNVVVRTRQALAQKGSDILALSVGTRLRRESQDGAVSLVRLLDGRLAEVPSDSLYAPPPSVSDESRAQVVRTAELFLGTSYYWGGRSGVQPDLSIGVDCSGLVHLSYRIHGLDLPRDSHEQMLRSRPVPGRELKPGDLVFLTDSPASKKVTHVMIYTGGDGVIESRKSSGKVLRSSFRERFGQPLSGLESGQTVTDHSFAKPRRRSIRFGTYLQ